MLRFLFIFSFVSIFGTGLGFSVGLKWIMIISISILWELLNRHYGPKSIKKKA